MPPIKKNVTPAYVEKDPEILRSEALLRELPSESEDFRLKKMQMAARKEMWTAVRHSLSLVTAWITGITLPPTVTGTVLYFLIEAGDVARTTRTYHDGSGTYTTRSYTPFQGITTACGFILGGLLFVSMLILLVSDSRDVRYRYARTVAGISCLASFCMLLLTSALLWT